MKDIPENIFPPPLEIWKERCSLRYLWNEGGTLNKENTRQGKLLERLKESLLTQGLC